MDTFQLREKKTKTKPTKFEDLTKEQIRQAILRKRECNAKAQAIVESLLERHIMTGDFLRVLPDINQSHFDDVVEERAIINLCGYPLCPVILTEESIPKQKYKILKTNKIYDITSRKSFCSNMCYKAAMHVKKQLLTSPLWFREYEEIPDFNLLPLDSMGSLGKEVDIALLDKIIIKRKQNSFKSVNHFARTGLLQMTSQNTNLYQNQANLQETSKEQSKNVNIDNIQILDIKENPTLWSNKNSLEIANNNDIKVARDKAAQTSAENRDKQEIVENENKNHIKNIKPRINSISIVGEVKERTKQELDQIMPDRSDTASTTQCAKHNTKGKKEIITNTLIVEVEKCLAEWITIDTMLFLFGEEKVREIVADKGQYVKEYLSNYANSIYYKSNVYDRHQELCRKLNILELEDKCNDSQTLERKLKPLPDYAVLQEESKKMQLKVKAFLKGETEIPALDTNSSVETEESNCEDNVLLLPLADKNAQNALRRRIVLKQLNNILPDLFKSFGLLTLSISSEVRLLINTFQLKPNNIMFKPQQWMLIGMIIIKLLSLREESLKSLLEQPIANQHMQLLLSGLKQDRGYLDHLISWLTDIERLLNNDNLQSLQK